MKKLALLLLSVLAFSVAACAVVEATKPVFSGSREDEPNLVKTTYEDFSMQLPPGWEPATFGGESSDVKAVFVKPGTSLQLRVIKLKQVGTGLAAVGIEKAREMVRDALPGNKPYSWEGPYALKNSVFAPIFEGYSLTVLEQGREKDLYAYTGYNLAHGLLGESYGIAMYGDTEDMEDAQPAFRAIIDAF